MIEVGEKVRCKTQFCGHVEGVVISYLNGIYFVELEDGSAETFTASRVKKIGVTA